MSPTINASWALKTINPPITSRLPSKVKAYMPGATITSIGTEFSVDISASILNGQFCLSMRHRNTERHPGVEPGSPARRRTDPDVTIDGVQALANGREAKPLRRRRSPKAGAIVRDPQLNA